MKVLTVKQPWASLIAQGLKDIENRTWPPPADIIGKRIAIHAGKSWDAAGASWVRGMGIPVDRASLPRGVLVCTVVVAEAVTASRSRWFFGPIGWVLRDVHPCTSGPIRGQLGLWELRLDRGTRLSLLTG